MILPDLLVRGLKVVFCGTAVGPESNRQGAYYAHPGNRFWRTLEEIGLTPRRFAPQEYASLVKLGMGFTDLAKHVAGTDRKLSPEDFDVEQVKEKVRQAQPKILAFTSKTAAKLFLGESEINYGLQSKLIGATKLFVLPSPAGAARRNWNIGPWLDLANEIRA